MRDADRGCGSEVMARVKSAWKKFREDLPRLTEKGFRLKLKRQGMCHLCEELSKYIHTYLFIKKLSAST